MTDTFKVNNTPVAGPEGKFYWSMLLDPPEIPEDCHESLLKAAEVRAALTDYKSSGVAEGLGVLKDDDLDTSGTRTGNVAISMSGMAMIASQLG